jgi:hypothetical protein
MVNQYDGKNIIGTFHHYHKVWVLALYLNNRNQSIAQLHNHDYGMLVYVLHNHDYGMLVYVLHNHDYGMLVYVLLVLKQRIHFKLYGFSH